MDIIVISLCFHLSNTDTRPAAPGYRAGHDAKLGLPHRDKVIPAALITHIERAVAGPAALCLLAGKILTGQALRAAPFTAGHLTIDFKYINHLHLRV